MMYFFIILPLFGGIIYIWFATLGMRQERRVAPYLVLFLYGLSYILLAALNQFGLFGTDVHAIEASTHAIAVTTFALTYGYHMLKNPSQKN
ncbi:hypothetical protein A3C87_00315 [Candidatus Kaiserbacteria bacterium RIFCSPHIGHO2_02_FULL_49_34]|uniref:Uncharacterized protein n=1 Tax=Candidatus Kaiserbacteria bacterium RIFCSPHIGHO2_02_FULL_49_34 TaxID=1798491 RepID=A0A1F6DKH9_9BACT|nr:MAG: hypothetical protein A3C87_00315 [Candidatus Kaiserbacteria bacterium RIFCSPHIGHO2_02_FULL_49_34]